MHQHGGSSFPYPTRISSPFMQLPKGITFPNPPPHVSSSFMQPLGGSSSCTPHLTHIPEREEKDDPIMEDDEVYKEHVNHIAYENLVIDG